MHLKKRLDLFSILLCLHVFIFSEAQPVSTIGNGWAGNSINTVIFRKNALVSDVHFQYAAWYDQDGWVVLGKRSLDSAHWEVHRTQYKGNIHDAHNSISIAVDGAGVLHMAWDQHASPLRYCKGIRAGSLELTGEMPMTEMNESKVSYPEFYSLHNGTLLFLYRDGASGNGNLVINRYDPVMGLWLRVQSNLLDGENKRNAYWQACVDDNDIIHLSWVWRESPDVSSNHDLCYARSGDGGKTWVRSDNTPYSLPITAASAEYIQKIPPGSELINQTSMAADGRGRVFIASYWKNAGDRAPQYRLVYFDGGKWKTEQVSDRHLDFSLSGAGTKKISIARPLVLVNRDAIFYFVRDAERGSQLSMYTRSVNASSWTVTDIYTGDLGQWEPLYDPAMWRRTKEIYFFLECTSQGDGETTEPTAPQPIKIFEWKQK
jgi:hypothetical protein